MMNRVLAPVMILTMFVGCAKKKQYDKLHIENPEAHISKSVIEQMCSDINDPCIYVPSVENTPYNISASRPFSLGDQKLVVAKIDKNEIKFLQIEEDERFNENINNFSPVLSLPVEHKAYKCQKDDYGDCTNTEVEDDELHWSKRKFVEINLDQIDVKEVNILPIQLGELFQKGCFSDVGQEVKNFKIEKDAINFVIKKTYKAAGRSGCISLEDASDLRYTIFTIDYGYSIAKLSSVVDKNYPIIQYPAKDESHFGFFKSQVKKKSVDNLDTVMGVRDNLLNRWSPNKKEVIYYLNEDFFKPENKVVLDSTYEAILSVNNSLQKANAGMKIVLEDGSGKSISDMRNNFIILVKDPQASGVIGYGPSVKNPKTGEIINARTVMYYGTIVKFVSHTYDELVKEQNEKISNLKQKIALQDASVSETDKNEQAPLQELALNAGKHDLHAHLSMEAQRRFDTSDMTLRGNDYFSNMMDDVFNRPVDLSALETQSSEFEKKIAKMSEQTFYHASQINFDHAMVQVLKQKVDNNEELKLWVDLNEEQRSDVIQKLLPFIWVPTLVHEFGHNLGLRHNFAGSTDQKNYYSSNERRALGMNRKVTYSSIMDYAYRQTNELPIMGKYDVAALRFAYAREVEDKSGHFVKVDKTINELLKSKSTKLSLKEYDYCSDENVSTDPVCNRFDEGSSYSEVAKHYTDSFMETYERRNFRGRRYDFNSREGDLQYLISLFNRFSTLRNFFEIYDQRHSQGSYESPKEEEIEKLADIKKAADIVFDFYMKVLETPAYHCAVKDLETNQFVAVRPFVEFAKNAGISFDLKGGCNLFNNEESKYRFYEFGKYFNNALDITVDRTLIKPEDTSQLDVRGFWMDKTVATMFLSMRIKQPTTTGVGSSGNFLDYSTYRERFMKFADGLLTNQFVGEVELKGSDGKKTSLLAPYSFGDSHLVNASYNSIVNMVFGLENTKSDFSKIFFGQLKKNLKEDANEGSLEVNQSLYTDFDVDQVSIRRDLSEYNYDQIVEFKRKNGALAYRFGFYSYNTKARDLMRLKNQLDVLEKVSPEQIEVLIGVFKTGVLDFPADISEELKHVTHKLLVEELRGKDYDNDGEIEEHIDLSQVPPLEKIAAGKRVSNTLFKVLSESLTKEIVLHSYISLAQ